MIVFVHKATYIRVLRPPSLTQPTDNLGKIFRTMKNRGPGIIGRPEWIWDGYYRKMDCETINDSEKRQIIGLLDDLNGVIGPKYERTELWDHSEVSDPTLKQR